MPPSMPATIVPRLFSSSSIRPLHESSNITNSPSIPRTRLGLAKVYLRQELASMYWKGVERELAYILLTLRRWQEPDCRAVFLDDENDDFIHGYDTFLDQVGHSSRKFTHRYNQTLKGDPGKPPDYEQALEDRSWSETADQQSSVVKKEIRKSLENRIKAPLLKRRARMLLQAGGFLDIDKVIEYRDPEELLSFWKRPVVPQLSLHWSEAQKYPVFIPLQCSACKRIIRGCSFSKIENNVRTAAVCEGCYRKLAYGHPGIVKDYKHSVLTRDITPEMSRAICRCTEVNSIDYHGHSKELFPVDLLENHLNASGTPGSFRCGLFELGEHVAEAKYGAILSRLEKQISLNVLKRKEDEYRDKVEQQMRKAAEKAKRKGKRPAEKIEQSRVNTENTVAEFGRSSGMTDESYEDIPFYLRPITNTYSYGNVHMALRLGPLLIENGVENTYGGVVITSRDPPVLQALRDAPSNIKDSLLLTGATERNLYRQERPRQPKRYKAIMKQVVGGTFCGFLDQELEDEIVDTLILESQKSVDAGLGPVVQEMLLSEAVSRVMEKMRRYLGRHLDIYIDSVAGRLLDPEVQLRWDFQTNHCQKFCDQLIDQSLFGPLLAQNGLTDDFVRTETSPLYLMSFVCRPGAYVIEDVKSKYDVPNGLIEEYLLKFRFGWHEESDVIDTLAEYWYDWGAFGRPLYQYQEIFPWDCTEAYQRYPTKCSECNIAKHVWAFPFDSWSIAALHLSRERQFYPPLDPAKAQQMDDTDWMRNRLTVLMGQDALLTAAAVMAKSERFRENTQWLHKQDDPKLDRLKLGGIHRAQPFSHHLEKGKHHLYFVAQWAHLNRDKKIMQYERLRDGRARKPDVSKNENDPGFDSRCGGGCGGFGCGGSAGCSGSCGTCGGACGSCAEGGCGGCSGGDGGDGGGGDGCGGGGDGCGGGCGGD